MSTWINMNNGSGRVCAWTSSSKLRTPVWYGEASSSKHSGKDIIRGIKSGE